MSELKRLIKNQLSHKTDLPAPRQLRIKGKLTRFYEIPFDPIVLDGHNWSERLMTGFRMLNECGHNSNILYEDQDEENY